MTNIIQFLITESIGISASATNAPIVTQGKTFEDLKKHIVKAIELFFKGEEPQKLGFGLYPSILTNFKLAPHLKYGVTA